MSDAAAGESAPPVAPARVGGVKRALVHTFVLFHLSAVVAWCFTSSASPLPLHGRVRTHLAPYMGWLGVWQGWTMFAPNPPMTNAYLEAEVTCGDGTRVVYAFPRMERLGYFERYRKERYRKWVHERVMRFGNPDPAMCEAAARLAARRATGAGGGRRSVELVRYSVEIPRPGAGRRPPRRQRDVIYRCDVDERGGVVAATAVRPAPSDGLPDARPAGGAVGAGAGGAGAAGAGAGGAE